MTEPKPAAPAGAWDAGTFLLAVALPLLSVGLLIYDVLARHPDWGIPLGDVVVNHFVRLTAPGMPVVGGLTSLYLIVTGGIRPGDRRFYLVFLAVNIAVLAAWTIYRVWG